MKKFKKYIKIGDKTYTCVEGRGVKIRNVKKINLTQEFKQYKFIEKGNKSYLVLQNPYMIQTID